MLKKYEDDLYVSRRKIKIMKGLEQPSKTTPVKKEEKSDKEVNNFTFIDFYKQLQDQNSETPREISKTSLSDTLKGKEAVIKIPLQQSKVEENQATGIREGER